LIEPTFLGLMSKKGQKQKWIISKMLSFSF
jgi:hypothetical protein